MGFKTEKSSGNPSLNLLPLKWGRRDKKLNRPFAHLEMPVPGRVVHLVVTVLAQVQEALGGRDGAVMVVGSWQVHRVREHLLPDVVVRPVALAFDYVKKLFRRGPSR